MEQGQRLGGDGFPRHALQVRLDVVRVRVAQDRAQHLDPSLLRRGSLGDDDARVTRKIREADGRRLRRETPATGKVDLWEVSPGAARHPEQDVTTRSRPSPKRSQALDRRVRRSHKLSLTISSLSLFGDQANPKAAANHGAGPLQAEPDENAVQGDRCARGCVLLQGRATEVEAQIQALARSAAVAAAKEAVSGKVALAGSLRASLRDCDFCCMYGWC